MSGSVLIVNLPADFWSGTGGAIVGSFLTGLVALGAAFLAAWLTRRHDRLTEARQACARLQVTAYEVSRDLGDYDYALAGDRYSRRAMQGIKELKRIFTLESASISEQQLIDRIHEQLEWLRADWLPAVAAIEEGVSRVEPMLPLMKGKWIKDKSWSEVCGSGVMVMRQVEEDLAT